MRIDAPYAIIVAIVLVCAVLAFMLWSQGGVGDERASASVGENTRTGTYRQLDAEPVRVPRVPDEDVARTIRLRERQSPPSTTAVSQ
jgi:hypothetical protein